MFSLIYDELCLIYNPKWHAQIIDSSIKIIQLEILSFKYLCIFN